jgi:PTS system nitrogen regulatory IIA component
MQLADLISEDHVFAGLRAADKPALLTDLARRAAASLGLPATEVAARLASREALGSTGVGAGIAVPHARVDGLAAPVGFFARLDRAIDYAAIDGKPVDLVFLLLSPANGNNEHLAALAAVSRRLRDAGASASLRAAKSAASLRAILIGTA